MDRVAIWRQNSAIFLTSNDCYFAADSAFTLWDVGTGSPLGQPMQLEFNLWPKRAQGAAAKCLSQARTKLIGRSLGFLFAMATTVVTIAYENEGNWTEGILRY